MKLAIASDEISHDFETAVFLGLEWGIDAFELKRLHRKRIPDVDEAEVQLVEDVLQTSGATLTSLSPGLFKGPMNPGLVQEEMENRFDQTIALAHRLRVNKLIIFGFSRSKMEGDDSGLSQVVNILGTAAERAESEELTLLLENEPGFWVDCPEALYNVVKAVNSPALKINWDPCNSLECRGGAPFPEGYTAVKQFVEHVHVKDAHLSEDEEIEYVVVGSGRVDWEGQFAALYQDHYSGYCVLEPHFGDRVASSRAGIFQARKLMLRAKKRVGG